MSIRESTLPGLTVVLVESYQTIKTKFFIGAGRSDIKTHMASMSRERPGFNFFVASSPVCTTSKPTFEPGVVTLVKLEQVWHGDANICAWFSAHHTKMPCEAA